MGSGENSPAMVRRDSVSRTSSRISVRRSDWEARRAGDPTWTVPLVISWPASKSCPFSYASTCTSTWAAVRNWLRGEMNTTRSSSPVSPSRETRLSNCSARSEISPAPRLVLAELASRTSAATADRAAPGAGRPRLTDQGRGRRPGPLQRRGREQAAVDALPAPEAELPVAGRAQLRLDLGEAAAALLKLGVQAPQVALQLVDALVARADVLEELLVDLDQVEVAHLQLPVAGAQIFGPLLQRRVHGHPALALGAHLP